MSGKHNYLCLASLLRAQLFVLRGSATSFQTATSTCNAATYSQNADEITSAYRICSVASQSRLHTYIQFPNISEAKCYLTQFNAVTLDRGVQTHILLPVLSKWSLVASLHLIGGVNLTVKWQT